MGCTHSKSALAQELDGRAVLVSLRRHKEGAREARHLFKGTLRLVASSLPSLTLKLDQNGTYSIHPRARRTLLVSPTAYADILPFATSRLADPRSTVSRYILPAQTERCRFKVGVGIVS
jgi:hypothetical protein